MWYYRLVNFIALSSYHTQSCVTDQENFYTKQIEALLYKWSFCSKEEAQKQNAEFNRSNIFLRTRAGIALLKLYSDHITTLTVGVPKFDRR